MKFMIKGEFRMGEWNQEFNKEVTANNEEAALEKLYAELGSRHKVKRRFIKVKDVKSEECGGS